MNSVCRDFPLLPVCVFGPFRPASGEREDDFPSYFAGREGKKRNSAEFRGKMKPSLAEDNIELKEAVHLMTPGQG